MLFGSSGQRLGLLSGGCLEADIAMNARKVLASGKAKKLEYDGSDEDDLAFRMGIGCGGCIYLFLQEINEGNNFLNLVELHKVLEDSRKAIFCQLIPEEGEVAKATVIDPLIEVPSEFESVIPDRGSRAVTINGSCWSITAVNPPPCLLVVGAGVDAQPVVALAATLGWRVLVCDPRPANARREFFPAAYRVLRCNPSEVLDHQFAAKIDAAIIMSHNISIDAEAINSVSRIPLRYLGLLGPTSRLEQVMKNAGLKRSNLPVDLSGPAGLSLGGDLPESIALAIVAECHAALHSADGHSISGALR